MFALAILTATPPLKLLIKHLTYVLFFIGAGKARVVTLCVGYIKLVDFQKVKQYNLLPNII